MNDQTRQESNGIEMFEDVEFRLQPNPGKTWSDVPVILTIHFNTHAAYRGTLYITEAVANAIANRYQCEVRWNYKCTGLGQGHYVASPR